MARSTSSIQPGCLGVNREWNRSLRVPATPFTVTLACLIWSLVRNQFFGSSKGAPLSRPTRVSLSR